jgi:hypothetical protein
MKMKKLLIAIATMLALGVLFATAQAHAATPDEQFMRAVAFFWHGSEGSEQVEYKVLRDGMPAAGDNTWHAVYYMDKDDPCVVHIVDFMFQGMNIPPGEKRLLKSTNVNFRNMPSPRAFGWEQVNLSWVRGGIATNWTVNLPADAICETTVKHEKDDTLTFPNKKCFGSYGWGDGGLRDGSGLYRMQRRLKALDYIRKDFCGGAPEPNIAY